jgi:type II secretory pathway pseudopilin PulG
VDRRSPQSDGYTLVEVLWAATLLIGLMGILGMGLTVVLRAQPRIAEETAQIQSGRAMIEQITRELREGSGLQASSPSSLSVLTFVRRQQCGEPEPPTSDAIPAIECRVTYACTSDSCTRAEALPDGSGSGSPARVVEGLNSTSVFEYSPAIEPRHVTVTLEYPAQGGGESITLSDGAALRNVGP